jgi:hypothetical protein
VHSIEQDKASEILVQMTSMLQPQNLADAASNHAVVAELLALIVERADQFPHSAIDEYMLALASM